MSLWLYSLGWWIATPLVVLYLLWRARRQPEYLAHWRERWGFFPRRPDDQPLVWVHAVSVGETRAAQPLVEALLARDPEIRVLLTHMTPTGRETGRALFSRRFGDRVVQCYLPYDGAFAPRRFLRAWRPSIGILMETELWPNLCAAAARARVPLTLVNARLSERSLRKGLRWRALLEPALRSLACVVAQSDADAERIDRLFENRYEKENLKAPRRVRVSGNLKFDVRPDEALLARGLTWRAALRGRPVVLAASTRDGEEELLLEAWRTRAVEGLLVVVPRHPQRFDEVAALLEHGGLRIARRSRLDQTFGNLDHSRVDVLLGDSMGEMFAWYAMADVAIIGGTLLPFGGQNLIEACAVGVPVILGPSTFNFEDAAEAAVAAGAALRVADARAAIAAAGRLLDDPDTRGRIARDASGFANRHRGATQRTVDAIGGLLRGIGRSSAS
jgi:3-deoxy-D-manno-octulosonic-acid transferase